jgi:hypothetical protein
MKIHQLLGRASIIVTNEEKNFIKEQGEHVAVGFLDPHKQWVAQNLVRKGVYSISNDRKHLKLKDR